MGYRHTLRPAARRQSLIFVKGGQLLLYLGEVFLRFRRAIVRRIVRIWRRYWFLRSIMYEIYFLNIRMDIVKEMFHVKH